MRAELSGSFVDVSGTMQLAALGDGGMSARSKVTIGDIDGDALVAVLGGGVAEQHVVAHVVDGQPHTAAT